MDLASSAGENTHDIMGQRRTLQRAVGCTGIGLHSGKPVRLDLKPAPAEHGFRFVRTDVGVEIPATLEYLARLDHATTLSRDGVSVDTVEHLLSALRALGVDDARIEVDSPEIPVLDGSAAPFVILIHEAGLHAHAAQRQVLKVLKPVEVVQGGKWARLSPADHLRVSYAIGFDHPLLRHQAASFRVTEETFVEQIAPARTFGFLRDVETLRKNGLAQGGSLENAVVIPHLGSATVDTRNAMGDVVQGRLDATLQDLCIQGCFPADAAADRFLRSLAPRPRGLPFSSRLPHR